jgi:hypothetical protein
MRSQTGERPLSRQSEVDAESSQAQRPGPITVRNRARREGGRSWLGDPRTAVWTILSLALLIGGTRKLLSLWRARRAIARLDSPNVTAAEIEAVADHGREGALELLRIFSNADSDSTRHAAGRALARLWRDDQLIAEEEQAIVRRGFSVRWNARRRYPRSLQTEIPVEVIHEVPFLEDDGRRVGPANLEWSHRLLGTRRASLEAFSPWTAGPGQLGFTLVPGDFETNGPHRLILHCRVRTRDLSDAWEIELPQMPFSLEFDPILRLDAILTLSDAARDEAISRAIRLEPATPVSSEQSTYLPIGSEWALRNPPRVAISTPLAADLAHTIALEFEGMSGLFPAGRLILSGQGLAHRGQTPPPIVVRRFELGPITPALARIIERPGLRRMRLHLSADPALGWADPQIRSVWPGQSQTNWLEVEVIRL